MNREEADAILFRALSFADRIRGFTEQPEIIMCKDCKNYDIVNQPYDEGFCRKLNYSFDKDSFCSYAERRTDGVDC